MNKIYSFKIRYTTLFCMCILMVFACLLAPYLSYRIQSSEKEVYTMTDVRSKEIDIFIDNAINAIPMPGLSVTITNQEETLYTMQYGKGIDVNSSFALGSTSKAITATAILMLSEEYQIKLDEPVNNYLSWVDTKSGITILDLLNHTSGIATYEMTDNLKYSGKNGTFEYSNANYNLLAEIIETITGDTFSSYIDSHIFSMLNMDNSFVLLNETKQRIVEGYKSYFGFLIPCKTKIPDKTTWIQAPSGYLCASPADMSEYLRFSLNYLYDSQQLLQLVQENGIQVNESPAIEGIYSNSGIYGMGWICKNVNGIDILYHTGKLSNYCTLSALIPQKNIGISIMCNMGDFFVGTDLIEKLYEGVISILINNKDMPDINKNEYLKQHTVINVALLILIALCVLPAVLYGIRGIPFQPTILNVCMLILIHLVIPVILIRAFPILGIPYEVVTDFAPDIFAVLIVCSFILFMTGVWKIISLVIGRRTHGGICLFENI